MLTAQEKAIQESYRQLDRKLEGISDKRKKLTSLRTRIKDEANQVSAIMYEAQISLGELQVDSDEAWQRELLQHDQDLHYAQAEALHTVQAKIDDIDDQERNLYQQEDRYLTKHEEEKRSLMRNNKKE